MLHKNSLFFQLYLVQSTLLLGPIKGLLFHGLLKSVSKSLASKRFVSFLTSGFDPS